MKIGYDAKRAFHNNSGLGNYSRDLIRILSKFYPENQYVLYNPKKKKEPINFGNNTIEVLPQTRFWKLFSSIWRQKAIVKQLKKDGVQLFHGLTGELPRGIHKTTIKTIVTIHDLIFVRYPELYSPIDRKIYFNKFKYAAENADIVIAISEQTKRDIVAFLKIESEKIIIIYQGCNQAFKESYTDSLLKQTRLKFNLPHSFILNVGTIEKRKNLLNLVKAIKDIDISLVVIGNDKSSYVKEVKAYIESQNLTGRVHFLKNVSTEELAQMYQLATIFVYPSIFEGFGIPIIESLYSKTAVITSKESCFSEAGGPDSIYINPLDSKDIKQQIDFLLKNGNSKKLLEEKGLEYVQKFNDSIIAKNLMAIYNKLLDA